MDLRSLVLPGIQDADALRNFRAALNDTMPRVEEDITRLRYAPGNRDNLSSLARAIRGIGSDASLHDLKFAFSIAHPIEMLLSRLRAGEIVFSELLAEGILLATDRLEMATEAMIERQPVEHLRLPQLSKGLERLAKAPPEALESSVSALIETITGFKPPPKLAPPDEAQSTPPPRTEAHVAEDLRFFYTLAQQLEMHSPLFKGRTLRILRLSLETNKLMQQRIDPAQLQTAVYMHDIGMMFLPESVWLKVGWLTREEKEILCAHPGYASGILSRMQGWETAARIVAQHHETADGSGYPNGEKGDAICDGAKLLAIVDAFEAVMLKHVHRGRNRSVLRAIAEINACDKQFAPEWIAPFNRVIRKTVETG
ncbi:MAG: HD domain-containing protein [Betaproteobacteria bacterium]|nr:HD domain-containing protein [Betaproteobacteria bacterium]